VITIEIPLHFFLVWLAVLGYGIYRMVRR